MSDLSKCTADKEMLDKLLKAWKDAEADEHLGYFSPNYMVIVYRVVNSKRGRYLKHDTYLFGSEVTARACYNYYEARGGISSIALVYVMKEWGYTFEPNLHGGA